ncbi:hypothetical protein LTS10_006045 [Elasticomyces elasticus]|nr:hypothetical protein LTS10_006045 [Elasticomyces elasticus]
MIAAIPVLGAILMAAFPTINALGCYGFQNDIPFTQLHGRNSIEYGLNMMYEVKHDIITTCHIIDGMVFKKGDPSWTHCTDWNDTTSDLVDNSCYTKCQDDCKLGIAGFLGTCLEGCDPNCGGFSQRGTWNSIAWEVAHANDDAQTTMTYDTCFNAYWTEAQACNYGSEQNHDGFWFRIDPNGNGCPISASPAEEIYG